MDLSQRIAQFENMVQADPDNDMAHFSLGGAYLQAGRHRDAAEAFKRSIAINPGMSKAYQMAGQALAAAGDTRHPPPPTSCPGGPDATCRTGAGHPHYPRSTARSRKLQPWRLGTLNAPVRRHHLLRRPLPELHWARVQRLQFHNVCT